MTYYAYDNEGYYTHPFEPQISSRLTAINGYTTYLHYANCTEIEPPTQQEGYRQRFLNGSWTMEQIPVAETAQETNHEPTQEEKYRAEIASLKNYLDSTDYCVIKCIETGQDMESTYPSEYQQRAYARDRINELESILGISK